LRNPAIKPAGTEIAWTRDAFRDLLRIRAGSSLFRMRSAADIRQRLTFHNTGSTQIPTLLAVHLDGTGYAGAGYREILYLINVDKVAQQLTIPALVGGAYVLHPVHQALTAADRRVAAGATFDSVSGQFNVPARSAAVFVVR